MVSLNFTKPSKKISNTSMPKTVAQLLEESEELLKSTKFLSPKSSTTNSTRAPNDSKPGHEVLDFFSARFHNNTEPFVDHIKDRSGQILAVHNYYVRPEESYESVWFVHHSTINTITIIHNHPFNQVCEGGPAKNGCKIKYPNQ